MYDPQVLAEIPTQFGTYMRMNGIRPFKETDKHAQTGIAPFKG